jgi:hypothetical protein
MPPATAVKTLPSFSASGSSGRQQLAGAGQNDRVIAVRLGVGPQTEVGQRTLPSPRGPPAPRRTPGVFFIPGIRRRLVRVGHRGPGRRPAQQHVDQQHEALRDLADRSRGDHQQTEKQQQDQQGYGDPGGHRALQQGADAVADEPARVVHLHVVGGLLGDVQQARRGDDQRTPADQGPAPVLRVGGLAHEADGTVQQKDREQHREATEEQPYRVGDPGAEGPGAAGVDRDPDQDREAEQQQPGAVAAVFRIDLLGGGGLPADAAGHPPDAVREAHPERADPAADPGRDDRSDARTAAGGPGAGGGSPRPPGRLVGARGRGAARGGRGATPARRRSAARHGDHGIRAGLVRPCGTP